MTWEFFLQIQALSTAVNDWAVMVGKRVPCNCICRRGRDQWAHCSIDIYQWLREVCSNKLLQSPIILGGPGVVVQIDESQFRHKPKVKLMINNNYLKVNSLPKPLGSMLCRKYLLLQKINKHNNINHI